MAKHLYVCIPCRKQIEKVLHRTEDIPETVACPVCGQQVKEWGTAKLSSQHPSTATEVIKNQRDLTGKTPQKVRKR